MIEKSKNFIVYKVTSPSGKCYIGITSKSLHFRKQKHLTEMRSKQTNYKFHNAIRKYNSELCWEIIDNSACSWEHLIELEKYYIQLFNSFDNGYNSTLGGDGITGWKHSEESKVKMSGSRPQTSKALLGKKKSEEHKNAVSKARKALNIIYSEADKEILALKNGAKRFNVFKDGMLIGSWINKQACARDLNLHPRAILGCLSQPHKFKTHKKYTFKYAEEVTYS